MKKFALTLLLMCAAGGAMAQSVSKPDPNFYVYLCFGHTMLCDAAQKQHAATATISLFQSISCKNNEKSSTVTQETCLIKSREEQERGGTKITSQVAIYGY